MWISRYFVCFIILSCFGWMFETTYCTIRNAKWENRGFLYGPICPIYGVGGVLLMAMMDVFSGKNISYHYVWWQVFLVALFGSIILEYLTSWVLEKLFHAYWWDYSNRPFNINGRVYIPYSIGFGCAGLLIAYIIAPALKNWAEGISSLGFEILGLVFMCIISVDATLTVSALTHFETKVAILDENLNMHMEGFVENFIDRGKAVGDVEKHSLSAQELLAGKEESVATKFLEEKERFSREGMERIFRSMGRVSKSALHKVQGFRKSKKVDIQLMEKVLAYLEEHMTRKNRKK